LDRLKKHKRNEKAGKRKEGKERKPTKTREKQKRTKKNEKERERRREGKPEENPLSTSSFLLSSSSLLFFCHHFLVFSTHQEQTDNYNLSLFWVFSSFSSPQGTLLVFSLSFFCGFPATELLSFVVWEVTPSFLLSIRHANEKRRGTR
jgi:hypothetical protein